MEMTREEFEQYAKENGLVVWSKEMSEKAIKALKQEPTTKNDLGIDCIDRNRAIERLKLNLPSSDGADNSRDRHRYIQVLADLQAIRELPSVTPQEPKTGHWIEQIDHEENCRTLICSNCDRPALHDEDSIWEHKFCPHCGAKMVDPQESEDKE